ncbi:neopullulanase SusA [Cellvibrio zantedeschiae]|uniref:Neopullulanase SusA n=1 Tax=Cellvibrio zantedeschiae TaxID=1237077 RepID=A0ABQ3ALN9_9GAMM|nr:glycoside hydrolase family 13 protein [Cellvibrio zantedeschiae]GGY61181.1 neopullulanase SusA [Cellvibrio zantedeschiae]
MKKLISVIGVWILSSYALATDTLIKHVEPLSWWVGMQHSQLQLMVHGENISTLTPEINYPGVTLVNTQTTDNKNFLFINLNISEATKAGSFVISFKSGDKQLAKIDYRLDTRAKNSAMRKGFSSNDVIYLLMPDRFANGSAANDSMADQLEKYNRTLSGGRHGGDLKGMQEHLDYIANMGFTMIWPTPLVENNQLQYSYHGYSATNHYKIDSRFGSNQDYKNYVIAANKKGLGVIQDVVLNHIGSGHWWMKDMPAKDWINFPDNYTQTTHRRTAIHDPHAAPEDATLFTDGWFVPTMPDLNQRNPLLATYLIQNSVWWIEYANLSGIREDTYSYSDKNFLSAWGKYLLEEYPNFNVVGEEWTSNQAIVASWQKGKRNDNGYISYIPSLMDFPVHDAMRTALTENEGWSTGLIKLYETIANDFIYADPMNMVVFPENHDTSRIFSALNDDVNLYKNAMVLSVTTRGIPQFFYGSEVLATSPKERDDGAVRSDMPGGWAGDNINAFSGKGLTPAQKDAQAFLKTLLNWRKTNEAVKTGKLVHYVPENSTYVYFRYTDSKTVMVVLNKNTQDSKLDLARFQNMLKGKASGKDILTSSVVDFSQPLTLKARTPMVIEL